MDFESRCGVKNNSRNNFRVFEIWKFACRKHSSILVSCHSTKRYLLISKWHHVIFCFSLRTMPLPKPYKVLCAIWSTPKPKGLGLTPKQIQGKLVCRKTKFWFENVSCLNPWFVLCMVMLPAYKFSDFENIKNQGCYTKMRGRWSSRSVTRRHHLWSEFPLDLKGRPGFRNCSLMHLP